MPGGDGTGPAGMGPMTGRAAGYCAGYAVPGYMNPIPGRGYFGGGRGFFGRGGGRGRRNGFYATGLPGRARFGMGLPAWGGGQTPYMGAYPYAQELAPQQEIDMLKSQAEFLKQEMEDVQERMKTLGKASVEGKGKSE